MASLLYGITFIWRGNGVVGTLTLALMPDIILVPDIILMPDIILVPEITKIFQARPARISENGKSARYLVKFFNWQLKS